MASLALLEKHQFSLTASTLTDVYTCPAGRTTSVTLFLCNRGAATTFRTAIGLNGEADDVKQYTYYGTALPANNTLKLSFTLNENDVLRVWVAAAATVSCSIFLDANALLQR